MATFKAEVYAHQKKQDGTYNIKIRVTHQGKRKYIATPWFVTSADLTRTLKIKNHRYIDMCDDLIRTYRNRCDELGIKINDLDVAQLTEYITSRKQEFRLDFFDWCRICIQREHEEGRNGTATNGENALRSFMSFLGGATIDINSINRAIAGEYADSLTKSGKLPNTVRSYVAVLVKYYNAAINRYNDETDIIRSNPFAAVRLPRVGVNKKRALTIEQIKLIRDYKTDVESERVARDAFMLSFYLIGMNAVDLINCTDLKNGILTYNRTKTKARRSDKAEISIDIQPECIPLIERNKARFGERVFMFGERWPRQNTFNVYLTRGLAAIGKKIGIDNLTFYSARHSWATIASVDAKIDVYTVHLALNHVSNSMAITETYIKRDFSEVNAANRRVLDLLL